MPLEHPPGPGVCFIHVPRHDCYGHFSHEQQCHRFKALGEVSAQKLPWRTNPTDHLGLTAFFTRQPTTDLALVFEDIEMSPDHLFGVVETAHLRPVPRATLHLPFMFSLLNPQPHNATFSIEFVFGYLPVQAQPQKVMKHFLGCHAYYCPNPPNANGEEPEFFCQNPRLAGVNSGDPSASLSPESTPSSPTRCP
jgi:hypothetical protein